MKLRKLVKYESYRRPTNPGAAGSPTMPAIRSYEVLQQFDEETGAWENIPVVHDEESRDKASAEKLDAYRSKRR